MHKVITIAIIFILSMQFPILNDGEISVNTLPINTSSTTPNSIKLDNKIIGTTYSTTYTATEIVDANQRTLLPIIQSYRTQDFIPPSQDTIYSVAWIDGSSTQFTFESRLIENIYGIGWLEQGSIFNANETFGYNALHSLLTTQYPSSDFILRTEENGNIKIYGSSTTEKTTSGNLNLITLSLLGLVKFENGDVNITEQRFATYNFTLPNAGNNYYAEYTWNEPENTDVDMDLTVNNDNLIGTINFTFNSGYFYQTREINYGEKMIRYWTIPFSVFIHYSQSTTTSSLSVSSINFAPSNSIGKKVLLTENERIEKTFVGYKFSLVNVNKNINLEVYQTYSTTESGTNDYQYEYNIDNNYLGRNIIAITNIKVFNIAREEITAVSLPYVIINGTSYELTNNYLKDLKDTKGVFLSSSDINRGIDGTPSPNLNTNSQENFYSYTGATIELVYYIDIALIFVKFVIYNERINFYVEVFTTDGNQYPMKIIQYWDPALIGRTYHPTESIFTEWTQENSGNLNGENRYLRTKDSVGNVSLYGDNDYTNSTVYCLLNYGTITDNPQSEDNNENIRDNNTVLYYITSTEIQSSYNVNTLSYMVISPQPSSPSHELGLKSFSVSDTDINTEFNVLVKTINNGVIPDKVGLALFIDSVFFKGEVLSINSNEEKSYTFRPKVYRSGYHNATIELIPLSLQDTYLSNNFGNATFYAGVDCNIISPIEGETLSKDEKIVVSTLGPATIVQFKVGSGSWISLGREGTTNKWSIYWNSKSVSNGNYVLEAKATTQVGTKATDSINITVYNPPDIYGVRLSTDINSKSVNPGKSVEYLIKVENIGNVQDIYDFSTIGGGKLNIYSATLEPYKQTNITLNVTVPKTAKDGDYYNITVRAVSRKNSTIKAELFTSTLVKDVIKFGIEIKAINILYAAIGEETETSITIKNIGTEKDIINLKVESSMENVASLNIVQVVLESQEDAVINLKITLPGDIENNTEIIIKIIGESVLGNIKREKQIKVIATTEKRPIYNFEISSSEKEKKGFIGEVVEFIIKLKNIGNRADNILLSVKIPENWNKEFNESVELDVLQTKNITLKITVPNSALIKKYAITVNGISENNTNISRSVSLRVDVVVKKIVEFELNVDNETKTVIPGSSANFLITITNKGNSDEVFIFSAISEVRVIPSAREINVRVGGKEQFELIVSTPSEEKELKVDITVKSKSNESIVKTMGLKVIVKKQEVKQQEEPKEKFFIPMINYYLMLIAIILLAVIKKRRRNYEE